MVAINTKGMITSDRSKIPTPIISPTTASHRHLHSNDTSIVDVPELTKRLQIAVSSPRRSLSGNRKSPNPTPPASYPSSISSSSTSSSSSSSTTNSPTSSIICPSLPEQFIFKRPEYNDYYHQTHFHHHQQKQHHVNCDQPSPSSQWLDRLNLFSDHTSTNSHSSTAPPTRDESSSPTMSKSSDFTFANQFHHDLETRYGKWGKLNTALCKSAIYL